MNRRALVLVAAATAVFAACNLNPQPLPPGGDDDNGPGGETSNAPAPEVPPGNGGGFGADAGAADDGGGDRGDGGDAGYEDAGDDADAS